MRNLAIYRVRDNKSGSAYNLTQSLGVNQYISKELKHELLDDTMFLNFGRSRMPEWWNKAEAKGCTFINHPNAVARAVNKIKTFRRLNAFGITTLPHTTKRDVARAWYEKGYGIMVRNRVRGCCGKGIEFIPPASMREGIEYNIPKAPLYTMYIDKKYEYRLHIFCDEVIDIQQKKKMGKAKRDARGIEEVNEVVRTNNNGWVFARNDIEDLPTYAINQAKDAVKCLGLDFAAIDMFYVPVHAPYQRSKFYVCEVNTSPSLSDSNTLSRYLSHIEQNKNNDWYKLNKPEGFTKDRKSTRLNSSH